MLPISWAIYWLAPAAGLLLVVVTYYPGLMNGDGIVQLTEARTGQYHDWQPPLIGHIWSVFDSLIPGPSGMLVLQNLTFWLGLAATGLLLRAPLFVSAAFVALVGLYPPILSSLGAIWKDVMLGGALLLSFALLLLAQRRGWLIALAGGLLGLLYALSLRHNALPAVVPFALWAGVLLVRRFWLARSVGERMFRCAAVATVLLAMLYVAAIAEDRVLANAGQLYPAQQILVHDLVALSLRTGQTDLLRDVPAVGGPVSVDRLRCLYTPESAVAVFGGHAGTACDLQFERLTDAAAVARLGGAWLAAVMAHPGDYLAHRLDVFSHEFSISTARVCYPLQASTDANSLGVSNPTSPLSGIALISFTWLAYNTPLYAGWLYLVLCGALLIVALRRASDRLPRLVLATSGLLYGLTYLVVGTTCDFRMHWWTVVAAVTLGVTMLLERRATFT